MATTEKQKTPPASPHLQYPEMIMEAIEAVSDKDGLNKTTISKHIEDTYGDLPAAHSTLLSHHLNKMKESGELVMVKNNYLKPDPNSAPRRGRGRPPKNKEPGSQPSVVSSSRPRGRPPKPKDGSTPPPPEKTAAPTVSGKKRGRPPKAAKTEAAALPPSGSPEDEDEN